ncbi:DUF6980 family protein, partial [Nocardia sp. NPDC058497]|uniref:DUF6980 family protein n=1 Tax=Nocardia sp. NPDC058497 TaxID=3346529 RepID=UPI003649787F
RRYCPYCGYRLPDTLRIEWFKRVKELGLTGADDPSLPEDMRSDSWWTASNL